MSDDICDRCGCYRCVRFDEPWKPFCMCWKPTPQQEARAAADKRKRAAAGARKWRRLACKNLKETR